MDGAHRCAEDIAVSQGLGYGPAPSGFPCSAELPGMANPIWLKER